MFSMMSSSNSFHSIFLREKKKSVRNLKERAKLKTVRDLKRLTGSSKTSHLPLKTFACKEQVTLYRALARSRRNLKGLHLLLPV